MAPNLEIASFSLASALLAARAGTSRIELCRSRKDGGLTPSLSTFNLLRFSLAAVTPSDSLAPIPVYVMIRPHARDFAYSEEEVEKMKGEMEGFGREGVDGFVFGCLKRLGEGGWVVDEGVCSRLLVKAGGRPCTFHRAFDELEEERMEEQLEVLIKLGFSSILTSGGKPSAVEGKDVLKMLVQKAKGRIEVIVGGGVRSGNVGELRDVTGGSWFHSSAVVDERVDGEGEGMASEEEVGALRMSLGLGVEG